MATFRSRRLEARLGSILSEMTFQNVEDVVNGQVRESFDLDFKSQLYGGSDKDKRDLCTDVAALANTAGGLIIIGIAEDDQARAGAVAKVDISDGQQRRLTQVIGAGIVPLPSFEMAAIEDPREPGRGVLVIAVLRSPVAPHAVVVNDGYRFPRRSETTTRFLTEPEVADSYRLRFAGGAGRLNRAMEIENEAISRLDADEYTWMVVSLVPNFPGDLLLDRASLRSFEQSVIGRRVGIVPHGMTFSRAMVGRRRLLADGTTSSDHRARYVSCELHDDGAGVYASVIGRKLVDRMTGESQVEVAVEDEMVVNVAATGLRILGSHARDRAATNGEAIARVSLFPLKPEQQAVLAHTRSYGIMESPGKTTLCTPQPPAERTVALDAVAVDGPELLASTYLLTTEVVQMFGWPEVLQMTRDGVLRRRYWGAERWRTVSTWAERHGVQVTEDVVG